MLNLDAIEQEITADKYGDKRFGPQCLRLIDELRKYRVAMEETLEDLQTTMGMIRSDDDKLEAARDRLREALRGAK